MHSPFRTILTTSLLFLWCLATTACAMLSRTLAVDTPARSDARTAVLARSHVWRPTNVGAMDLKAGPQGAGSFPLRGTVVCDYLDKRLDGASPKFACAIGGTDEVKVKFGAANGEVYGEVLATRLLWALGFGADRMYPVTVVCRGCPERLGGASRSSREMRFDPAVIERRMSGSEWPREGGQGWSWAELHLVNAKSGGAPRAHVDALKLIAVFLQHTDSKPEQQRILCQGSPARQRADSCPRPFLMISDVGLTFGRANQMNSNEKGGVNLMAWRDTPVWKDAEGCTGNLPRSFTGTLENPVISEDGRRFLADLLVRLSDRQIRDLFETARVHLRLRSPGDPSSGAATAAEWVDVFKEKRAQIVRRRCA